MPRSRIALETRMHSPWVSRPLSDGHEVIMAQARNLRLIGVRKTIVGMPRHGLDWRRYRTSRFSKFLFEVCELAFQMPLFASPLVGCKKFCARMRRFAREV
jgi:hypothetical protein